MDKEIFQAIEKVRDDIATFIDISPCQKGFWDFALSSATIDPVFIDLVKPNKGDKLTLEEFQSIWCNYFLPQDKKDIIMKAHESPSAESIGLTDYDDSSIAAYWKSLHHAKLTNTCSTPPRTNSSTTPDHAVTHTTLPNTPLPPVEVLNERVKNIQENARIEHQRQEVEKKAQAALIQAVKAKEELELQNKLAPSRSHILPPPVNNADKKRPIPEPDTGPEAVRREAAQKRARVDRIEITSGPGSVNEERTPQELVALDAMATQYGPSDEYNLWINGFALDYEHGLSIAKALTPAQVEVINKNIPLLDFLSIHDVLSLLHKTMQNEAPAINHAWDGILLLHAVGKLKMSPAEIILMELARCIHDNKYSLSGAFTEPSFIVLAWTTSMHNLGVSNRSLGVPTTRVLVQNYMSHMARMAYHFTQVYPRFFGDFSYTEAKAFLSISAYHLRKAPKNTSKLTPDVVQFLRGFANDILWIDDFKQASQTITYSGTRLSKPSPAFLNSNMAAKSAMKSECLLRIRMMLDKALPMIFPNAVSQPQNVKNLVGLWAALERCINTTIDTNETSTQS